MIDMANDILNKKSAMTRYLRNMSELIKTVENWLTTRT